MQPDERTFLLENQRGSFAIAIIRYICDFARLACGCLKMSLVKLKILLVYFFTDWPWETVKYMCMPDTIPEGAFPEPPQEPDNCRSAHVCLLLSRFLWTLFRIAIIVYALVAQLMTCFRRDRISTNTTAVIINDTSNMTKLNCDDQTEIVVSILIPDIVIVLLAVWVYFGLEFGKKCYCRCCGWKELNVVMKADTAKNLNKLVQAARDKLIKSNRVTVRYTVIPIVYIVLSQVVSVIYLIKFKLVNKDVVIQAPMGGPTLGEDTKYIIIGFLFIGFIALDVLYLQVMLKYAYRCQMVIYCLKIIKQHVKVYRKDMIERQFTHQQMENRKKDIMDKTENAYIFIKQLNASSGTIALLIIIAAFQAVNCAIMLLSNELSDYYQIGAVAARLLLWAFLAMFSFHKAAGVIIVEKKLRNLGWHMKRQSLVHDGDSHHISLRAKMFGISIKTWLPYLIVLALVFVVMVGAKIKWYEIKM